LTTAPRNIPRARALFAAGLLTGAVTAAVVIPLAALFGVL